jgi:integration host factor subunit beta
VNKLKLIEMMKNEAGISKNEAATVVNLFFNEMSESLAADDRVEIRGLCSFYVKKYKAYVGRNPKTGEKIKTKPKKLPFFKCGRELKERVDR